MSKKHDLTSTLAMLDLSEQEFERMLPDLMAFYLFARMAREAGAVPTSFIWVDDGFEGQVHSIRATVLEKDEEMEFRGPAWRPE